MARLRIEHYSDILCVWAYVAQVRIDELLDTFGDDIELGYHFVDVFGDCRASLEERWSDRGGLAGYGEHVREVVARFDHCSAHPEVWSLNTPESSMSCHVFLRGVGLLEDDTALPRAAWALRQAFFRDGIDVSRRVAQLAIAEQLGLDRGAIEEHIASGRAHAALSRDARSARQHQVEMSPTLVFDGGRQRLAGNVGYRVIQANVRELLSRPAGEASWC